jgi:hypothetical protein
VKSTNVVLAKNMPMKEGAAISKTDTHDNGKNYSDNYDTMAYYQNSDGTLVFRVHVKFSLRGQLFLPVTQCITYKYARSVINHSPYIAQECE